MLHGASYVHDPYSFEGQIPIDDAIYRARFPGWMFQEQETLQIRLPMIQPPARTNEPYQPELRIQTTELYEASYETTAPPPAPMAPARQFPLHRGVTETPGGLGGAPHQMKNGVQLALHPAIFALCFNLIPSSHPQPYRDVAGPAGAPTIPSQVTVPVPAPVAFASQLPIHHSRNVGISFVPLTIRTGVVADAFQPPNRTPPAPSIVPTASIVTTPFTENGAFPTQPDQQHGEYRSNADDAPYIAIGSRCCTNK